MKNILFLRGVGARFFLGGGLIFPVVIDKVNFKGEKFKF